MSENHGVRSRLWGLGVAVALLGAAWLLPALAPVVLPALPPAPASFTAARDGRLLARHRYGNVPVRVVALPVATKDPINIQPRQLRVMLLHLEERQFLAEAIALPVIGRPVSPRRRR